jgi:AraC family transcriptional regulator of adaptative response/methylated-DNA-[protein]-cysteine methyltransferase
VTTIDAVTPGDVRSRGRGLVFSFGVGPTPFGSAFAASTPRGVHRLAFVEEARDAAREADALAAAWPLATLREDAPTAAGLLERAFAPRSRARPFHLWVRGTNLQVAVWRALLRVPLGALASYSDLAAMVSAPRTVRAVAGAIARNPVAWVIPCHRVLRRDGDLAGYAWGVDRKAAMVGWEAARA